MTKGFHNLLSVTILWTGESLQKLKFRQELPDFQSSPVSHSDWFNLKFHHTEWCLGCSSDNYYFVFALEYELTDSFIWTKYVRLIIVMSRKEFHIEPELLYCAIKYKTKLAYLVTLYDSVLSKKLTSGLIMAFLSNAFYSTWFDDTRVDEAYILKVELFTE